MIAALQENQVVGMMADRVFGADPNTLPADFLAPPCIFRSVPTVWPPCKARPSVSSTVTKPVFLPTESSCACHPRPHRSGAVQRRVRSLPPPVRRDAGNLCRRTPLGVLQLSRHVAKLTRSEVMPILSSRHSCRRSSPFAILWAGIHVHVRQHTFWICDKIIGGFHLTGGWPNDSVTPMLCRSCWRHRLQETNSGRFVEVRELS